MRQIEAQRLPPVERWHPARSGTIDIRIASDGTWYHEGGAISRPAMVRLFSSILRREGDDYWLVTPAEKLKITVEAAPFVASALVSEGSGADRKLAFRLNTDEAVIAGPEHRLWLEPRPGGGHWPMLQVRGGLNALITRPVYYELAQLALAEAAPGMTVGLWSAGCFFALEAADDA